jgi:hypothetical protein
LAKETTLGPRKCQGVFGDFLALSSVCFSLGSGSFPGLPLPAISPGDIR